MSGAGGCACLHACMDDGRTVRTKDNLARAKERPSSLHYSAARVHVLVAATASKPHGRPGQQATLQGGSSWSGAGCLAVAVPQWQVISYGACRGRMQALFPRGLRLVGKGRTCRRAVECLLPCSTSMRSAGDRRYGPGACALPSFCCMPGTTTAEAPQPSLSLETID